jgi:hypothetical protein
MQSLVESAIVDEEQIEQAENFSHKLGTNYAM